MFFNGIIGSKNPNRKMIPKNLADPILTAILEDDCNKLAELISNLEDVNSAFHLYNRKLPDILSNNPTMLGLCCFFGSLECFDLLRNFDASIKEEDDFGRNCVHFATAGGSWNMMRILDQSITDNKDENNDNSNNDDDKSNNNDSSSDDDTPIFFGRGIFRRPFFMDTFANMDEKNIYNKSDDRGLTPMHYGAMFGRLEIVRYLWTKGAHLDKIHDCQGNRPIHLACLYGHTDVVKFFVENGVKFESNKLSNKLQPIHYACIGGYIDTIEYLISLNADINLMANSKTPIFYAARYGSLGAVKLLVKHGATFKFKRRKNSPIVEAALGGHADIINYFLKNGCDPNVYTSTGETPLMAAITGNNAEVVKLLIKNGAKIDFEPIAKKRMNTTKNNNTDADPSDEEGTETTAKAKNQKKKENADRKRRKAILNKEIIDINNYNCRDTSDLLIAASRKGNIEIFKLILENIDIKKYIESDIEITNRKKRVNREMYALILEEKQLEMQRRSLRYKFNYRRKTLQSDDSDSDSDSDCYYIGMKKKKSNKEEEEEEEEEQDEDTKIFHKLCTNGYYSYGSYEDATMLSDPNSGKICQLFSNALNSKSLELLKILVENKLVPKDTNRFYVRMASEANIDILNYMLDNDLPFNKNDTNLKKEVFNLGKIEILEKFRQRGLRFDMQNDICFLSRIISSYNPELLVYVLDKIFVEDKANPVKKVKKKKRSFLYDYHHFDDFSFSYYDNSPSTDPVNIVLNKALQFPIAPNHSIIRRSYLSPNSSINFEKTISENEENLKKILNILLDRNFKFNPKGIMFTVPPCVSMNAINLLFMLMKEIEKRPDSEKMNFEKLKLGNIIHLLEEYDISEYNEFIDFLFARNFSPTPKETDEKSVRMRSLEEVDSNFSSALRTILSKSKYNDPIYSIRPLSSILTDSSDDDYFYDRDYTENEKDLTEKEKEERKKEREEKEKKENEKIMQRELNLITYMLNHGTPILDRSLRLIEKIAHKRNDIELANLAFKNLVLIDSNYQFERRYHHNFDDDEHKTPLELACKRGYYDIVVDLVQRGANINESGFNDYSSPLMFAMMSKNEQLINFLRSKNAKLPLNNPTCSPQLVKSRDRWLYSPSRQFLLWSNRHRKKKANEKKENNEKNNKKAITASVTTQTATAANTTAANNHATANATINNNLNVNTQLITQLRNVINNAVNKTNANNNATLGANTNNNSLFFNQPFYNNAQLVNKAATNSPAQANNPVFYNPKATVTSVMNTGYSNNPTAINTIYRPAQPVAPTQPVPASTQMNSQAAVNIQPQAAIQIQPNNQSVIGAQPQIVSKVPMNNQAPTLNNQNSMSNQAVASNSQVPIANITVNNQAPVNQATASITPSSSVQVTATNPNLYGNQLQNNNYMMIANYLNGFRHPNGNGFPAYSPTNVSQFIRNQNQAVNTMNTKK